MVEAACKALTLCLDRGNNPPKDFPNYSPANGATAAYRLLKQDHHECGPIFSTTNKTEGGGGGGGVEEREDRSTTHVCPASLRSAAGPHRRACNWEIFSALISHSSKIGAAISRPPPHCRCGGTSLSLRSCSRRAIFRTVAAQGAELNDSQTPSSPPFRADGRAGVLARPA